MDGPAIIDIFAVLPTGNAPVADEAAREAAEAAFQEVVESLEGATIEQIEQATGSTHISTTSCGEGCTEETFY